MPVPSRTAALPVVNTNLAPFRCLRQFGFGLRSGRSGPQRQLSVSIFTPMGLLTATRTVSNSRAAKTSVPAALRVVQDPSRVIHLNPLVIASRQDEEDNAVWHVTDRFRVACIPATTTYHARLTLVQDGIDIESRAPGVCITNKWRVRAKGEGEIEVVEEAVVRTSVFLIAFVESKLKALHVKMLEAMAKLLEEKVAPELKSEGA